MTDTITVMPNQSMLDVVLQGRGTLEGGMQMMAANGRSISDRPVVGEQLNVADGKEEIKNDAGALRYLKDNGIVVGTLGTQSGAVLSCTVVLKPVMQVVPTAPSAPPVFGAYEFDYKEAPGFINVYPIPHEHYPSTHNILWYLEENRYASGDTPFGNLCSDRFMDDKLLSYHLGWTSGMGFMMGWMDLGASAKTATFRDAEGNEAYAAPLIVLDNLTQNVADYIFGDLLVEVVSATHSMVTLRLTRFRSLVAHTNFIVQSLTWLNDAAGGAPDPLDPGNADKTILVLPRGTYTFGVATVCINGSIHYPPAAFTEVVEIA